MNLPQLKDYQVEKFVAIGASGQVFRATSNASPKKKVAVKMLNSMAINRKVLEPTLKAINSMASSLPGVLPILEFNFSASPYYCVYEWIDGVEGDPTLERFIGKMDEARAWETIETIAGAIASMHRHGIVHCDIKTSNILVPDEKAEKILIADAGLGMVGAHHTEFADHQLYCAPEQLAHPMGVLEGMATGWDTYSFGVVAYRLLTGKFPRASSAASVWLKARPDAKPILSASAIWRDVTMEPEILWPDEPSSEDNQRRRKIIERCLEIQPHLRWVDLREVTTAFQEIRKNRQIAEADARTAIVQKAGEDHFSSYKSGADKKLAVTRWTMMLGFSLFAAATLYAAFIRIKYAIAERDVRKANSEKVAEISTRDNTIGTLTGQLQKTTEERDSALANHAEAEIRSDFYLGSWLDQTGIGETFQKPDEATARRSLAWMETKLKTPPGNPPGRLQAGTLHVRSAYLLEGLKDNSNALQSWNKAAAMLSGLAQDNLPPADAFAAQSRLALAYDRIAQLSESSGKGVEALEASTKHAAVLKALSEARPEDPQLRVRAANANLTIAEMHVRQGSMAAAAPWLDAVAKLATGNADALSSQEKILLARVKFLQGLSLKYQGGNEQEAMNSFVEAVDLLRSNGVNATNGTPSDRTELARYYTELGEMIGRRFGGSDGLQAHSAALQLLQPLLSGVLAGNADASYLLARNYSEAAQYERDAGKTQEALVRQDYAVTSLTSLVDANPADYRYSLSLGVALQRRAEIQDELQANDKAVADANAATKMLEGVIERHFMDAPPYWRMEFQYALATAMGTLGHVAEAAGQTESARASFIAAADLWNKLKEAKFSPDLVENGTTWIKNRLDRLPKENP